MYIYYIRGYVYEMHKTADMSYHSGQTPPTGSLPVLPQDVWCLCPWTPLRALFDLAVLMRDTSSSPVRL